MRNTVARTAPGNHPAHEKALVSLWLAIDACNEFLDAHHATLPAAEHDCARVVGGPCPACRLRDLYADLRGILYTLELYANRLEDQARPFPEQLDRLAQDWRERDTPEAEEVVRALEALGAHGPPAAEGPGASPQRVRAGEEPGKRPRPGGPEP
jgi:hypothetical protein